MTFRFVALNSQPVNPSGVNVTPREVVGICQVYQERSKKQRPVVLRQVPVFRVEANLGVYVPVEQSVRNFAGIELKDEKPGGGGGGEASGGGGGGATGDSSQKLLIDFQQLSKEPDQSMQLGKVANYKTIVDAGDNAFLYLSAIRTQFCLQDHFVGFVCTTPKPYPVFIDHGFVALKLASFGDLMSINFWVDKEYKIIVGTANTYPTIVFSFVQMVLPASFEYPYVCTTKGAAAYQKRDAGPIDYDKFDLHQPPANEMVGLAFAPRSSNQVNQFGQIPYTFPVEESFNPKAYFNAVPFDFIKKIIAARK